MPRRDLQALTPDDLAALANRGLVKRAQRDLESGAGPVRVVELADGTVEAEWPDKEIVRLPPDKPLSNRACTCPALVVCRHVVGTVLSYQAIAPTEANSGASWDPGEIADTALVGFWKPPVWAAMEKLWSAGLVAELHRGMKPMARLVSLGVTLRFLVPHDARYVQCDCAEETPCRHVPLAVRAFRQLDAGKSTGLVSTEEGNYSVPTEAASECGRLVFSLFESGVANIPLADLRRWEALPDFLRRRKLLWPSEIASDLLGARDRYLQHDARFEAADVVRLASELVLRMQAIAASTGSVPQLFLRGSAKEEAMDLSFARFTGLGCHVLVRRKSVVLQVPVQDMATGAVALARREFANPENTEPADFSALAAGVFAKGCRFAAIGEGNLLVQGAKRNVNGELSITRARLSISPQAFEWEKLRSPVLVEDFEELRVHRQSSPPALLAPRRLTQDIHVCPVARVEAVTLDAASRRLVAQLIDGRGESIRLIAPFYSRANRGFQRLHEVLETERVVFVAGSVRNTAQGLAIEPSSVVFENGGRRQIVQPWIAPGPASASEWKDSEEPQDPLAAFLAEGEQALGELALIGLLHGDALMDRRWQAFIERGEQLGLVRFLEPARRLQESLAARRGALAWDSKASVQAALQLALYVTYGVRSVSV
jgi:hypothetical protein